MPAETANAPAGLGTSIVEALARQLKAVVRVTDGAPGTMVAIIHTQIAVVGDAAETAHRAV